jgi:predicted kinase
MELSEREIDAAEREAAEKRARAHWLLALGELAEPSQRPALLLIAGLPGSGKSTLAYSLAPDANFEVLRSDVVRKELTASHVGENIYTDAWTERTYGELLARAEGLFWQGRRVLIDANFRDDANRLRFLEAAGRWAVPALVVHCHADPAIIRKRLDARRNDASDADWRVYQSLQAAWQPLSDEVRRAAVEVNTSGDVAEGAQSVRARLVSEGLL